MDGVLLFPFCFSFVSMNNVELVIWMDRRWMNNVMKLCVGYVWMELCVGYVCMMKLVCWICHMSAVKFVCSNLFVEIE